MNTTLNRNLAEVIEIMKNHEIKTNENKDFLFNVDSVHMISLIEQYSLMTLSKYWNRQLAELLSILMTWNH